MISSDAGPTAAPVSGAALFARYAYPPNALGYCGPLDSAELFQAATQDGGLDVLRHLAAGFEGAWPYLQLIAAANGIADPLDSGVVEAYWVGNHLLSRVSVADAARSLADRFERRAGGRFGAISSATVLGGLLHHSFHVFAVYPWLGLLRAGLDGPPLEVLDQCRIRWGRVQAVTGDLLVVSSRALRFDGSRLSLGEERMEQVRHRLDGAGLAPAIRPGDLVSAHWDWVCDRLTVPQVAWLAACTKRNLDAVNSLAEPGPAVVCGA